MHSKMENAKYLSVRGKVRLLSRLTDDFNELYFALPNVIISEQWQSEKIFSNHRCHTYDICLLAFVLGVPAAELVAMRLPQKTQAQLFDEKIIALHNLGFNYRQISIQMGASYDYCKLVGNRQRKKLGRESSQPQARVRNEVLL